MKNIQPLIFLFEVLILFIFLSCSNDKKNVVTSDIIIEKKTDAQKI